MSRPVSPRQRAVGRWAASRFNKQHQPNERLFKDEVLDRTIDAVDDAEIEAIKAEMGVTGHRHPGSE